MSTISIICISVVGVITLGLAILCIVDSIKIHKDQKSIMFEQERVYKLIVCKDDGEYLIAQNLTLFEAQELQSTMNVRTRIEKED